MSYKENLIRSRASKTSNNERLKYGGQKRKTRKQKKKKKKKRKPLSKLPNAGYVSSLPPSVELENNKILVPPPPPSASNVSNSPQLFRSLKNNPQYVVEYLPYIFKNFRENERKHFPRGNYMESQREVTTHMRTVLIDWLVDVHLKFKMKRETLFISVNIIDRFMSKVRVSRKRLQLVGCTSLFIAAKYEEIYIPTVRDLERVCAHTYSQNDFLKMEKMILNTLKYELTIVTPNQLIPIFLECTASVPNSTPEDKDNVQNICEYVTELALYDYDMIAFTSSQIAASSLYYACTVVFGEDFEWNDIFRYYVGYEVSNLMNCIDTMKDTLLKFLDQNNKLQACNRKFSMEKYGAASALVSESLVKDMGLEVSVDM